MPGEFAPGISLLQEAKLQLESYAHRVARLVNEGKQFSLIEEAINSWPLDEEQRGTLWLYAWSLQITVRQRRRNRVPGQRLGTD